MATNRGIRFGVVVAAACMFGAGCGGSDSSGGGEPSSDIAANSAAPQEIPPFPVTADDRASAEAWAQTLEQNPCPENLRLAVLAIVQKSNRFPGSEITVTGAESQGLTGIPQCTFTVTGADAVATIKFAAITAATNKAPEGTLRLSDVLAADPTVPTRDDVVVVEPECRITQEFLGRLKAIGLPVQLDSNYGVLDSVHLTSQMPTQIAVWKDHTLIAKRVCADTSSRDATPGDSPDWILQFDATGNGTAGNTRTVQNDIGGYLMKWVSGESVGL